MMHTHYQVAVLTGCIVGFLVFSAVNIYDQMRGRSLWRLFRKLLTAWVAMAIILSVFTFFTKTGASYSREWLFIWMVFGFLSTLVYRFVLVACLRFLRRRGFNVRHIIVIGSGKLAEEAIQKIQANDSAGYVIVDIFGPVTANTKTELAGLAVSPVPENLEQYVNDKALDEVWIALPLKKEPLIRELLHQLRFSTANIHLVPDILGLELLNNSIFEISGMPVLQIRATPMEGFNRLLKRVEDILIGSIILILISPLLFVIACLVKISSPGPVIYKQKRYGWGGRSISVYKFRSMKIHQESAGILTQAMKGDLRITPLGSFLRKTSLDELPQFINVLQGRMSIVGPRPHAVEHNEFYKLKVTQYMQRHMVKPGITGWAQVNGYRGETDTLDKMEKRVEYDLYYIENWSLSLDLKIIFMTIFKGFVNKNAY